MLFLHKIRTSIFYGIGIPQFVEKIKMMIKIVFWYLSIQIRTSVYICGPPYIFADLHNYLHKFADLRKFVEKQHPDQVRNIGGIFVTIILSGVWTLYELHLSISHTPNFHNSYKPKQGM